MAFEYTKDSFQIYISSDGCREIYPENSPSHFKVRLKTPRDLRNIKEKWRVGLAEFGYDAEGLYNMGDNTDVFCQIYFGGNVVTISPKNSYAANVQEVSDRFNETIDKLDKRTFYDYRERTSPEHVNEIPVPGKEPKRKELKLKDHIHFEVSKTNENICNIVLTDVDDFGVSVMLRKMLGLHKPEKISFENYEFRMNARSLLKEISDEEDYIQKNITEFINVFESEQWFSSSFEQRNEIYKRVNADVSRWYLARGDELEHDIDEIIKNMREKYELFLTSRYSKSILENKESFTFEFINEYSHEKKQKKTIPFSVWTKIEFLIFNIFAKSVEAKNSTMFEIKPKHRFNPNLFSVLYVYSNIVDLVAVNDGNFRFLGMIFLKGDSTTSIKREIIENKSSLYKFIHVDTIDEIEIAILTSIGKPAPFIHGPVYVTLDFKNFHHGV